jgi:prepilin-type processing-associated H-X9-DG protein
MRTSPKARRRGQFTLIELLVVIAIVMILAGLLMPVLAKAREKARQTECMSRLKGVGMAFFLYASDYDDHLPCFMEGARKGLWWDGGNWRTRPWNTGPHKWYETLDVYLGSDRALLCPTSGFRYAINEYIMETDSPRNPGRATGLRISRIEDPAEKFLVGDSFQYAWFPDSTVKPQPLCLRYFRGDVYGSSPGGTTCSNGCRGGYIGIPHFGGSTTMVYCDGHVDGFVPDDNTWGTFEALAQHWLPYEDRNLWWWSDSGL